MKNKADAGAYSRNLKFFAELRKLYMQGFLTKQEVLTFRGQALSGDTNGAYIGLARLMAERRNL